MNKKARNKFPHKSPTVTHKLPTDLLSCIGRPNFLLKLKTYSLNKHTQNCEGDSLTYWVINQPTN